MALQVSNLSQTIGARIDAGKQELLTPQAGAQLRQILVERGVLLFPQVNMTDEEQVQFAGMLGNVRDEGENGIYKITLDPSANTQADYLRGSFNWHMDGTHDSVPVFASLLTAHVLSEEGGDTWFANSYAAYDGLPQTMKDRIDGLSVVHSIAASLGSVGIGPTPETQAHWDSIPERTHKLVWTHKSGRKSLVIGCHASHVVGMAKAESDALLAELIDWTTQDRFTYRHKWTVGDLLIWDNTGVLHRAEPYPLDGGRMMHRTTLLGEEAFA